MVRSNEEVTLDKLQKTQLFQGFMTARLVEGLLNYFEKFQC